MRLKITKSKNAQSFYIIRSTYVNGKRSSQIVEKLGTLEELSKKHEDPVAWAKQYAKILTKQENEQKRNAVIYLSQSSLIDKDQRRSFNGGYLFLQQIYYRLGLHKICAEISKEFKFTYDLNSVLSRLIFARVIFPCSKLSTFEQSKHFIEQPNFELQHIYRALDVLANKNIFIQSQLYKNSCKLGKRNDRILFYDCTNFFFESECESGLRQYGISKEYRPNPIVQMGLFMDGDGIPLAFSITPGNQNEQLTLVPLEEKIINDFDHSKFVVCTDAGLSSTANRLFNNKKDLAFVTTQSIKKLKKHLKAWCLDPTGWKLSNDNKTFDIRTLETDEASEAKYKDQIFYKERWINENNLEQKLIVTFSPKYKKYQEYIRQRQLNRANEYISKGASSINKSAPTDCKRFIKRTHITKDGEVAKQTILSLNQDTVDKEAMYDGFYAVCTNLEENAATISKINRSRWEIEECFRIMKTDFESRPVYLRDDNRIKAHFLTCFLGLVVFRYLEKMVEYKYTSDKLISTLRNMYFLALKGEGYIPTYERNEVTDCLHDAFCFRTDNKILSTKQMKKIFTETKKQKKYSHIHNN